MFAMGLTPEQIRARCREEFVDRNPLGDYTVPRISLVRGQRAEAMLRRSFGDATIEDLDRQYFCVACDLLTGELVVHRRGPLYEKVGTSMCLPGVFPPVSLDDRLLVDGGVLDNLPVEPMSAAAEGPVIATDVTAEFRPPEAKLEDARKTRPRLRRRRLNTSYGRDAPLPRLKETLVRSITIGSVDALGAARKKADILISPATGAIGLLDFGQIDRMVDAGRAATREALAAAKLPLG
jgi:NTE family protein